MAGSYRDWQFFSGPPWLQGTNDGAFVRELGGAKDDVLDRARMGVLARFPGSVTRETDQPASVAPTDALDHTGADRQVPRAPAEGDTAFSGRLLSAWDDFGYLGGPYGLLNALAVQGYTGANIIQDNGRYWFLSGGVLTPGTLMTMITRGRAGWQFSADGHDVTGDLWSRFALLFPSDAANLSSANGQAILNAIVNRWRPGLSTFIGTFVVLAGRVWGWPTTSHTWGSGNWGSNSVRFIPGL